jgi:predicted regulator of Ras-like GTPase activity (Roadblock/LC7/MglB family)
MKGALQDAMKELTRIPGARGALIVDPEAGVPVAAELETGISEMALAALAGALFLRTASAVGAAGHGGLRILQVEAAGGHLVMVGAGSLLVAVLASPAAQLGLVRVKAARAAAELAR